ncbi:MAG: tRNA 2-thiouridine(34) synthase MnmA [Candidatus Yonathbacteria bacterium]|nr:tRNA 2-thiouridine(34) synthase MnmA [Candidatus Yonathbacteria bacterium]NTW47910.1 tRNA 2-thiouridine(34) synthase MnmA [Candidatus Yonathbacteria bacterium]
MERTLQKKKGEKINKSLSVFVGLSGGVDSSVSAALLKDAGYDVTGVFIRVWSPPWMVCTQHDDEKSAREVAEYLRIPFRVLDLSETYKREIVDDMIDVYAKGKTPNPDALCNKYIKFDGFLSWAIAEGADFIATGHYARIAFARQSFFMRAFRPAGEMPAPRLLRGRDANKDQSYFLWTLGRDALLRTLFPIGGYTKPEVRAIAKTYGLPTAGRKDSQGLCFVGHVDMKEFLSHYIESKRGDVLDNSGHVIGQHDGAHLFTIGQRHGFHITAKTPDDSPYYVVGKDISTNTITVAHEPEKGVWEVADITIEKTSWVGDVPRVGTHYSAQIRYRQKPITCIVTAIDTEHHTAHIHVKKPILSVPGQSLVLYNKDVCLGGGVVV